MALTQAAQSRRLFKNDTRSQFKNQIENMVSNKVVCEISDKAEDLTKGLNYEPRIENLPTINTSKLIHGTLEVGAIKKNFEEI